MKINATLPEKGRDLRLDLARHDRAVAGVRLEQPCVRARGDHAAVDEQRDLVDRVEQQRADGGDDGGATRAVGTQARGDPGLGVGVDGRRRRPPCPGRR